MRRLDAELEGDHGGVAVFAALLLVVLFGMSALVLDIGNMYWERRQLQNGADAAALAVAKDCAEGVLACASATSPGASVLGSVAEPYANGNANDGRSAVRDPMPHGNDPASCDPGSADAPNPLTDGEKVKVSTETIDADTEKPFLTHWFAWALNIDTTTVSACAVASWGNIGGATTIPIAICEKSWEHWTGAEEHSGPPAHLLKFGTPPGTANPGADCKNPSGETYPGGFGFLERNEDCMAPTDEDDMADGATGDNPNDPDSICSVSDMYDMFVDIIDAGETALLPIFDYHEGSGTNGQFHIIGYGAFVFEGYDINGGPAGPKRYEMDAKECNPPGSGGGASCLKGYFTEFIAIGALPGGSGPGFGTTGVFLEG